MTDRRRQRRVSDAGKSPTLRSRWQKQWHEAKAQQRRRKRGEDPVARARHPCPAGHRQSNCPFPPCTAQSDSADCLLQSGVIANPAVPDSTVCLLTSSNTGERLQSFCSAPAGNRADSARPSSRAHPPLSTIHKFVREASGDIRAEPDISGQFRAIATPVTLRTTAFTTTRKVARNLAQRSAPLLDFRNFSFHAGHHAFRDCC